MNLLYIINGFFIVRCSPSPTASKPYFYHYLQAMKSCDVDLSDSDTARLALRFDEEESRRVHIQKFMRFVRGEKSSVKLQNLWKSIPYGMS